MSYLNRREAFKILKEDNNELISIAFTTKLIFEKILSIFLAQITKYKGVCHRVEASNF